MKNILTRMIVLCSLIILYPALSHSQISWISAYDKAIKNSAASQKPIFMYFYNNLTEDCKKYMGITFRNQEVISFLNENFVCIPIDVQQDTFFTKKYGIFRVPAALVLDSQANNILRLITYYPPDKLISSLSTFKQYKKVETVIPNQPQNVQSEFSGSLFYESFDSIYGWGNDGSAQNTLVQISLIQGLKGNAFKIGYELPNDKWNYVQIHRELSAQQEIKLPDKYTVIFNFAGEGDRCTLDMKFCDRDGTNYGVVIPVPVDNKPRRYTITSDEINYLWGGKDKVLEKFSIFNLAISPNKQYWQMGSGTTKGVVYIDEFIIIPGIYKTDKLN